MDRYKKYTKFDLTLFAKSLSLSLKLVQTFQNRSFFIVLSPSLNISFILIKNLNVYDHVVKYSSVVYN